MSYFGDIQEKEDRCDFRKQQSCFNRSNMEECNWFEVSEYLAAIAWETHLLHGWSTEIHPW